MSKKNPNKTNENQKMLDELKEEIAQRLDNIEQEFYSIGLCLIRVNLCVKNFRRWVRENCDIDVSTGYTLMRVVKRDIELKEARNFQEAKAKISFFKLCRLLKFPVEFVDAIDFQKTFAIQGKLFTLLDMPRELFADVLEAEFKAYKEKGKKEKEDGEEGEGASDGVSMERIILQKAVQKLERLTSDLNGVIAVVADFSVKDQDDTSIAAAQEHLRALHDKAGSLMNAVSRMVDTLDEKLSAPKSAVA